MRAFCLSAMVSICFAQDDPANINVGPPQSEQSSTSGDSSLDRKNGPVKVDVDLVLVPVTVTDQRDHVVIGLQKNSFQILDQNSHELIRHFSSEDVPISLGIIFDTSDSMWRKIERSCDAVLQFLRPSDPQDEFFLVGFSTRPELLVDFTSSVDEIQDAFLNVNPDGTTALFDAIYLGLDQMKKARNKRKALLIVSDGGDNHSRYSIKEVWSVVREADVQVYALGIFDDAPRTKAERAGPDILHAITGVTGGRTFPIYSLKKIGDAVGELSLELRNQYLIAYRPTSLAHDGKWHKITVRVTPPATSLRIRVYAREGYYAPVN